MKKALIKDTYREIRRTLSRFFSIFVIVALGVGFFAGVKATTPDMKLTADKYFDDYRFMDIRVVSTLGLDEKDVTEIKNTSRAEGVFPTYTMDALVNIKEKDFVLKAMALPLEKVNKADENYINRAKVVEGRYPEKPNECLVERGKFFNSDMPLGSRLTLASGTDKDISESLKVNEYTIVGAIESPYYVSFEMGSSTIGSGKIEGFIMIPQENFKLSVYTDVFLTFKEARGLLSYDKKYKEVLKPVKEALEDIGETRASLRYEEIVTEVNKELSEKKKELADGEEESNKKLAEAFDRLEASRKELQQAEKSLSIQESNFQKTIKEAESKLKDGKLQLEQGEKEYASKLLEFNAGKKKAEAEFPASEKQIEEAEAKLKASEVQLNALRLMLQNPFLGATERAVMEQQLKAGEAELAAGESQLQASKAELEANKKALAEGEQKLRETRVMLDSSKAQLDSEEKKLEASRKSALAQFKAAHKRLKNGKVELLKGEQDYEKGKKESEEKIADAKAKIADAEKKIRDIKEPTWYVLDRDMNIGFVEYGSAADRIDAIAEVFPVFLFLVAALVSLTTMTRMVDAERTHIGTLKALGYSKLAIASKYLIYSTLACLGGSLFGILIGFKVFPTVISNAYAIIFTVPPVITEFNIFYAVTSTAAAVLVTTIATLAACYKELMVEPAELMRPKAPKAGKRIFLERLTFLWSHFNFTQKMTARNLVRYKKRFFMTVIGISGCTALLLSGFGLKDSIVDIVGKQFEEIYNYDMRLDLKEDVRLGETTDFLKSLTKEKRVSDYMLIKEQSVDVGTAKAEKSAVLFVPENISKMKNFINLKVRTSGKEVLLTEEGVVITEKLSKMLQADIGDEIYIKDGETRRLKFKVTGITENYVSHYIYMSPALYEKAYGEKAEFKQILGKTAETTKEFENKLSTDLLKDPEVAAVSFVTGISKNFGDMIGSLDYVILVLIASAGALAFVVLYNLANINVEERMREIATIKVLGFYDNEVSAYVYRENVILTIIGMLAGLILGIFLHQFIVSTTEVDYVMFGRNIKNISFVYSAVLTMIFAALVNFVMYFRLKKVEMVESLKSVD
jgi:putative ABC transport system permease protein